MATKKAVTKGRRYTPEEKQEVVNFVNEHNAQNRRGGATAASKKFGVSQLTIGSWLKSGVTTEGASKVKKPRISVGSRSATIAELLKLDELITSGRKELESLEVRFEKLKAGI